MIYVYSNRNELRASCAYVEDAAMLVDHLGDGATLRLPGIPCDRVVWTEGVDGHAAESYDHVATVVATRDPDA